MAILRSILFKTISFAAQKMSINGNRFSKTLIILSTRSGSKLRPDASTSLRDSFSLCKRFLIKSDFKRPEERNKQNNLQQMEGSKIFTYV